MELITNVQHTALVLAIILACMPKMFGGWGTQAEALSWAILSACTLVILAMITALRIWL